MSLRITLALCALLFLIPAKLFAGKITFASPEDLPPKAYMEKGELKGIYVEIIREICKRLNLEPDFQFYPWARALALANSGQVDAIFPPLKTQERSELLYFPKEPVGITRNVIFAPRKTNLVVKSLDDLKGLIVGINDQYSYGDEFDKFKSNLKLDSSLNEESQINKLAHKGLRRIDVAAASEEAFKFIAQRMKLENEFQIVYILSEKPSYIAFSKAKGPNAKKLSEDFSRVLKQLKKEGVIQKIVKKYIK